MAKKNFSDENRLQSIVDAAWNKYQKANAKQTTKKTVKKAAKKPAGSRKK